MLKLKLRLRLWVTKHRVYGLESKAEHRMHILTSHTNAMTTMHDLAAVPNPTQSQKRMHRHYVNLMKEREQYHIPYAQRAHEKVEHMRSRQADLTMQLAFVS